MWKKLDSLCPKNNSSTSLTLQDFKEFYAKPAVDNKDNSLNFDLTTEQEILDFMKKYHSGNESSTSQCPGPNSDNTCLIKDILDSVISANEITSAIKGLKRGKSSGIDGIPVDLFIDCEQTLNPLLKDLFNYILEYEDYPAEWALGLISPVHKGGPDQVGNFRKISVLPAISKILENVMNNRLKFVDRVFKLEDPYNGGFKENSRTSDNIFILNSLIDQAKNSNSPLYVCFVDFRRAFDCINRKLMFYKLINQGYSSKTLRLIINMYSKTKASVKLHGLLSDTFEEMLGVAQGGVLSPYLFVSFLKDMSKLFSSMYGVKIDETLTLCYLLWADDLVLFSNTAEGLQDHLDKLHQYCAKWQLIVNNLKTKVLIFNKRNTANVKFEIGGTPIEIATKYKYLGVMYSTVRQVDETKTYILNSCSRALFKIKRYGKQLGQLPPETALKLFDSLIIPLIDYGSEIWYKESIINKLETVHLRYLKRILKVRQQTSTLAVYGDLGRYPLKVRIQGNVLKYLHRLHNSPEDSVINKIVKMLQKYNDQGKSNWLTKAEKVFNNFHACSGMHMEMFVSKSEMTVKSFIKSTLQKQYESQWKSLICDMDKQPKLRTYCTFKTNLSLEPYLNIIIPKQRLAIARFRCSAHFLAIETGRHQKPKVPVELRKCIACDTVEDEIHHLMFCSNNKPHRDQLFKLASTCISNFENLSPVLQFRELLMSKDVKLLKAVAIFLTNSSLN